MFYRGGANTRFRPGSSLIYAKDGNAGSNREVEAAGGYYRCANCARMENVSGPKERAASRGEARQEASARL